LRRSTRNLCGRSHERLTADRTSSANHRPRRRIRRPTPATTHRRPFQVQRHGHCAQRHRARPLPQPRYLLTNPVAGHVHHPRGQRALLLWCQRAWSCARHVRAATHRVGLCHPGADESEQFCGSGYRKCREHHETVRQKAYLFDHLVPSRCTERKLHPPNDKMVEIPAGQCLWRRCGPDGYPSPPSSA